jgi:glutathione S-transferase
MPEALKLYHAPTSPNSRRVRMFLAEKGISLPLVSIDLAAGEQHGDAYRAINPRRVVPTLMLDDGTAIGEVLAIWRYLEEAYQTTPLLGATPKDKALVTMWERRAELEGFAAVMEGVRNAAPRLAGRAIAGPHDYAQIPELVERSKRRVANFYSDMDETGGCFLHRGRELLRGRHHHLGGSRFRDACSRHACSCREPRAQVLVRHRRGKTECNRIVRFYEQNPH